MTENNFEVIRNKIKDQLKIYDRNQAKLWTPENDTIPANLTISFYPKEPEFIKNAEDLIEELKITDPGQFWYEAWQFHLTWLTHIPTELVGENNERLEYLSGKIKEVISENVLEEIKFRLVGVSANNSFTSITAYPVNFDLANLRMAIREKLGVSGKTYEPDFEKIGWLCLVRYRNIPSVEFENKVKSTGDFDLGEAEFGVVMTKDTSITHIDSEELTVLL